MGKEGKEKLETRKDQLERADPDEESRAIKKLMADYRDKKSPDILKAIVVQIKKTQEAADRAIERDVRYRDRGSPMDYLEHASKLIKSYGASKELIEKVATGILEVAKRESDPDHQRDLFWLAEQTLGYEIRPVLSTRSPELVDTIIKDQIKQGEFYVHGMLSSHYRGLSDDEMMNRIEPLFKEEGETKEEK